jgi:hypothetical protein
MTTEDSNSRITVPHVTRARRLQRFWSVLPMPLRSEGQPSEPARQVGLIASGITMIVGLAVAFGLKLSDEQQNAIAIATPTAAAIIYAVAEIIRRRVYAPRTVQSIALDVAEKTTGTRT